MLKDGLKSLDPEEPYDEQIAAPIAHDAVRALAMRCARSGRELQKAREAAAPRYLLVLTPSAHFPTITSSLQLAMEREVMAEDEQEFLKKQQPLLGKSAAKEGEAGTTARRAFVALTQLLLANPPTPPTSTHALSPIPALPHFQEPLAGVIIVGLWWCRRDQVAAHPQRVQGHRQGRSSQARRQGGTFHPGPCSTSSSTQPHPPPSSSSFLLLLTGQGWRRQC